MQISYPVRRANFFLIQALGNPQFLSAISKCFKILKIACQPHVSKYDFFHLAIESIERVVDANARELVRHAADARLHPKHCRLVAVNDFHQVAQLNGRWHFQPPAGLHHAQVLDVGDFHGG